MLQIVVLCYHAVSVRWDAALSVTPDDLRRQIGTLVSRGWVGARFTDAVLAPAHPKNLVVTFDDAFDSVRSLAAPILREFGVPGTVYVPTAWVGRPLGWPEVARWQNSEHAQELEAMTWESLRELQDAGWEIGAHTRSHPHLPALSSDALEAELSGSRAVCERELGARCRSLAYPFGEADARIRAAAIDAGFEAAAGLSSPVFGVREVFEWPRVGIWHGEPDWRFTLKVSALVAYSGAALGSLLMRSRLRRRTQAKYPPTAREEVLDDQKNSLSRRR